MIRLVKVLLTPSFYSLSVLFVFIGSCLIFIPPIIPVNQLQAFAETVFPYTQPGAAERFLNSLKSLGIEFYGGAILSFAFGVVEEKEELARQEREENHRDQILLEIAKLSCEINELSSLVSQLSDNTGTDSVSLDFHIRKNRWLWRLLFG